MLQSSRLPRSMQDNPTLVRLLAHRSFRRMLRHQGIDLTRNWTGCEAMIFRALQKCANCAATEACRAWLAEAHPRGVYPSFCPNGAMFEACRLFLDPRVSPPKLTGSCTSEKGELAVVAGGGGAAIKQLGASNRVQEGGILAEIDQLMGQFL
jgi:hypothetical protein